MIDTDTWRIPSHTPDTKRKVEVVTHKGHRVNGTYKPGSDRVVRQFRGVQIHVKWRDVLKWRVVS